MKEDNLKKYSLAKNIVLYLNIFIAIVIILASQRLSSTPLGKTSMALGFVMATIATALIVLDKI